MGPNQGRDFALAFNIPPTAMTIWRQDHNLKTYKTDLEKPENDPALTIVNLPGPALHMVKKVLRFSIHNCAC